MKIYDIEKAWENVKNHLKGSQYRRERSELLAFPHLLRNGLTFVDIGASLGPYTWMAHYNLSDSKIIAIEANPYLCEHIRSEWKAVTHGGSSRGNDIEVLNNAISDTPGTLEFRIDKENFLNSSAADIVREGSDKSNVEIITIKTVVLDELFAKDPPDLFKIDVEGFEWRAVNGARKILEARGSRFLVEIHPWGDSTLGKRPSDVFRLFREQGYGVNRFNQHWLFEPDSGSLSNNLKGFAYGLILDHPGLKRIASKLYRVIKSR